VGRSPARAADAVTGPPPGPLDGLRVVSLAEQYPGPFATLLLGDLGADVIAVERPAGGDPARAFPSFHEALNRGKRSVALDLKHPEGRAALLALCRAADVLLEGFRPGTLDRLGLGYERVAAANPRLVYVSISGFGADGPYRDRPAHDISYQAVAGLLAGWTGQPGAAPPLHLADLSSGLFAVLGALAALQQRQRTGRGSHVDTSMTDGLVTMLAAYLVPVVNRSGPPAFPVDPGYGLYPTADGATVALGIAHEDRFWAALCRALSLPALETLRFPQRVARREELVGALAARIAECERPTLETAFETQGVPYAWVNDLDAVPVDPQVAARGLLVDLPGEGGGSTRHVRQPLRFDAQAPGPQRPVPALGAHTREVLREVGYDDATITRLRDAGALAELAPPSGAPS
jgi:crotonobetainyl-CoA:carnitine CoA-transferase CaiB-like acyl-CoA transferase